MGEILPLAVAALSGSTLGAVLSYWTSRRKAPVERDSAHAAAAAELSEAAAGMIEPLTAEVKRLDVRVQRAEEDAAKAREDAAKAREDAEAARREAGALRKIASEADDYIRDLHVRWDSHRTKPHPPFWRWLGGD